MADPFSWFFDERHSSGVIKCTGHSRYLQEIGLQAGVGFQMWQKLAAYEATDRLAGHPLKNEKQGGNTTVIQHHGH